PPAPAIHFVGKQTSSEVLGTDFIGTPVTSKDGGQIGKISNLVFGQDGRIELAVIGIGGFLGIGEKEVAVPFDSVKSDVVNNKHVCIVDATKDQLNAAPTYKTLNDQAFNERMADWRAKAAQSWADVKSRAAKAYDEAKSRVEEARHPSEQPKPAQQ
ncbi:MAG: PRC-barrel domain-containing protein, partial [Rhodomicrobium sp.]|nr:PRC-barrel domain-containing protein [Rhodomicrobium sp.]